MQRTSDNSPSTADDLALAIGSAPDRTIAGLVATIGGTATVAAVVATCAAGPLGIAAPAFAAACTTAINGISRVREQRVLNAAVAAVAELKRSQVGALDASFFESPAFEDLLTETLQRCAKTDAEEKRRRLLRALRHGTDAQVEGVVLSRILDVALEMESLECRILSEHVEQYRLFAERYVPPEITEPERHEQENKTLPRGPWRSAPYYGVEAEDYQSAILYLINRGLLLDDSANRFDARPLDILQPTPLGVNFMRYIEGSDENGGD